MCTKEGNSITFIKKIFSLYSRFRRKIFGGVNLFIHQRGRPHLSPLILYLLANMKKYNNAHSPVHNGTGQCRMAT